MSDDTTLESASELVVKHHLTDEEIDILNAARTVLTAAARRQELTWSGGLASAALDHADWAVFNAISGMNAYGHQQMTKAQIHNDKPANGKEA